jgi:hypothetical protein
MAGHGKNKQTLAAESMAKVGAKEAQDKFAGSAPMMIEIPSPCYCNQGVKRAIESRSIPNDDGRHWHESQFDEYRRQVRESDTRRGLKYTKERQ